jgi:serine/threonine protein kinase
LLDFGLAKLRHETAPLGTLSTVAADAPMTAEGTILGTIQYMAPEQLEGKEADSRTDIFAFGAIIHEMITGRRTFEGASQASVIAAILDRDPPALSTLKPMTPRLLERIVKKCLAKNPDNRWQAAGDLLDELKWIAEEAPSGEGATEDRHPKPKRIVSIWAVTSTVLLAGTLLLAAFFYPRPATNADQIRFDVATPQMPNPRHITVSPDGRWIAFVATAPSGATALFVRRGESTVPEQLAGTDGAVAPFWSPDSRYIAFFGGGRIK